MLQSLVSQALKFVLLDLIGDILYFPVWWYSEGLHKVIIFCLEQIKDTEKSLALRIWLKNLLVPMFGQYDWQGRLISFFMRIFQIIYRFFALLLWSVFVIIFFLIYLILPFFVLVQILLVIVG
jgi:hypothetical protein